MIKTHADISIEQCAPFHDPECLVRRPYSINDDVVYERTLESVTYLRDVMPVGEWQDLPWVNLPWHVAQGHDIVIKMVRV